MSTAPLLHSFFNFSLPEKAPAHVPRSLSLSQSSAEMVRVGVSEDSRLICATLAAQSLDQMLKGMHQAKVQGADAVEIALDCVADSDLEVLLRNKPIPVVLVSR